MSNQPPQKSSASTPTPAPADVAPAAAATPAWIDSTDPKKRQIAKFVMIGVWIYVAALWLLAMDQTFNWGIFGPKIPPLP